MEGLGICAQVLVVRDTGLNSGRVWKLSINHVHVQYAWRIIY
jgi:hypothetical protein